MMSNIPTRVQIQIELERLVELVASHGTIEQIADELDESLSILQCDIANRAGVELGTVKET